MIILIYYNASTTVKENFASVDVTLCGQCLLVFKEIVMLRNNSDELNKRNVLFYAKGFYNEK